MAKHPTKPRKPRQYTEREYMEEVDKLTKSLEDLPVAKDFKPYSTGNRTYTTEKLVETEYIT